MHMSLLATVFFVAFVALLLGLVLGWLFFRSKAAAMAATAAAEVRAQSQGELATLTERTTSLTAALATERDQHGALRLASEAWRTQLDGSSNSIARLTERVARVSELESDNSSLRTSLEEKDAELRRIAAAHGQSSERAAQVGQQLLEANAALAEVQAKYDTANTALQLANEARAGFEQAASRVPALEAEVASLTTSLETRDAELRRVSTENGQSSERAQQLGLQLQDANSALADTQSKLATTSTALQAANEARAGFEQQALRVPTLEQQLMETSTQLTSARDELASLRETSSGDVSRLTAELVAEREAHGLARQDVTSYRAASTSAETRVNQLTEELTELRTRTDDERVHGAEKLQLLLDAKDVLSDQFKTLATEILEDKAKRFTEQNQTNLGQLLDPLRTQLTEFKGKVEEAYHQEGKDRTALAEQVRNLASLNQTLSEEAKNLTRALKGEAKTQGNWGELILERVLEVSGLEKGREYLVQDSQTREDGSRAQPDVVLVLPEERRLVVDAKVSLIAYERFVSANTDEERTVALKQHLDSVRTHIKGLSEKNYQQLYGLQSPDFVLAFLPLEPAFMLAVTNDSQLFMDAWEKNVLLVSPSTLLFVVRTVAHLWRQEAQSRNAQEIAKRGATLYDKLSAFAVDLLKVGDRLTQAKASYDEAHARLATGHGNIIRQAEMLKDLGVKPTKTLPASLVAAATGDDDILLPRPSANLEEAPAPTLAAMTATVGESGTLVFDAPPALND